MNHAPDYYWRDYTGEIPRDAVPGGLDINGRTTYVGQAYWNKWGILPGTIYPGNATIKLPLNGCANPSKIGAKILCSGDKNCFTWENAESSSLHLTTIGKHLVIGGFEDEKMLNFGRVMYQGELIVGKVFGFETEKAKLYFVHGEKEFSVTSYQVLIYNRRT
ncbi:DUF3421 domain containing protein [Asbolus verrucosus]|uniref:DUF3421 domain containing protein n=1 Tax=Asbolus verrucosus TaxID=1661398 RepID=A0A482W6R3_ASBVE|nr:DUF3421 domain containing protein [Asbolus verrucosus]